MTSSLLSRSRHFISGSSLFRRLVLPGFFLGLAASLHGATIYFGDAAAQGLAVTDGGGIRADLVGDLTYVSHSGAPVVFTVPADGDYRITEVNFFADLSGTLTPFVARYLGVSTQLGSSYEILAKGDPLTVTSADNTFGPSAGDHLENRLFTSGGSHPVISVLAGQQLVAGWFQSGNIVYIGGGGTQGAADYVYGGNSIAGPVGSALSANSGSPLTGPCNSTSAWILSCWCRNPAGCCFW
ncbi:MAG: hypothetical protein R3F11_27460 [Verrucomicrobiales bacterium]